MSELPIVKSEPPGDDEENGRTTPVRQSILEYETKKLSPSNADGIQRETPVKRRLLQEESDNAAEKEALPSVAGSTNIQQTKETTESNESPATAENRVDPVAAYACSKPKESPCAVEPLKHQPIMSDSCADVLVKDEPEDEVLADLEKTMARLDGQFNDVGNEIVEQDTSLPPPPKIADNLQLPSEIETVAQPVPDIAPLPSIPETTATATQLLSPEAIGVLVKEEMADTEFAELEEEILGGDVNNTTTESRVSPPPPPPTIQCTPMQRLRVKSEFSNALPQDTSPECSSIPQDFFEGILNEKSAPRSMIPTDIRLKDEPIPDNFFDDLLVDKVQERIEEAETQDLEEKYSDRLKQLRELELLEHSKLQQRDKKKNKKSKKKSRKRLRSSSPTRERSSRSSTPEDVVKNKLMRWSDRTGREDWMELPSTSQRKRSPRHDLLYGKDLRNKLDNKRRGTNNISPIMVNDKSPQHETIPSADIEIIDEPIYEGMQPLLPEIKDNFISAKQKRDRIVLRAKTLIAYLNAMEAEKEKPLSTFLHTSAVRKLPASHSYRNQHIYENRSPLHNINNVSYKFNSHARRFKLEEWGLAALPSAATKIAKLIGYDALAIYNKLKQIKVPAKIRKVQNKDGVAENEEEDDDEMMQSRSSLFCNATTQTDETVDFIKRKPFGYDIGVQAVQPSLSKACQTLETESPSTKEFNSDDLPIMNIMREMNDNQLMALHDFAELLKEPACNSMDMYRLRQRMLDIYKCSQQPSVLAIPPTTISLNSYTSIHETSPIPFTNPSPEQFSAVRIQSACSADGSRFSVNDPRINFTGNYRNRDVDNNEVIRNINAYDQRYTKAFPSNSDPRLRQRQEELMPPQCKQTNGQKFYGRGGLRR